ncbi:MAG: UvrB/UvrC motif-containing protein [Pirellulaceae bacterium]|jgi:protein arginine kinase activator|nr:UvrB/UvrC motif-containing protein [Pirellulaceae bacterium]MDP7015094.1 UvrB/UvrC motif-containing protein [Pirellulaceae bacterium]
MKCQYCEKPATFHITELTDPKDPQEFHLCEDHARLYLKQPDEEESAANVGPISDFLSQQFQVGQTADELARLDQQSCPICGVTFYEFRHAGRLGCPHDYVCFAEELEPLIVNIHGATEHQGKHPKRGASDSDPKTELIRLRREMKDAVELEDYELASNLRDEIRRLEDGSEEGGEQ